MSEVLADIHVKLRPNKGYCTTSGPVHQNLKSELGIGVWLISITRTNRSTDTTVRPLLSITI
jgi:hypothetical protein